MNKGHQLLCAWSGIVFLLLFGIGFWPIAGFLPPPPPSLSADKIAELYRQHTTLIRLGALLIMAACGFYLPWISIISSQMRRIGNSDRVLANTQLVAGAVVLVPVLLPAMLWTAAAFRPERTPELTLALNDFAWLLLVMPFSPALIEVLAIGFAILSDKSPRPIFPRWAGYLNIWVGLLFIPGSLITFFKRGPFAWNGLLAFYLPFGAFSLWLLMMFWLVRKAIRAPDAPGEIWGI